MKNVQIVRDSKGIIVATYEVDQTVDNGIPVETVLEDGQTIELMERVPVSYVLNLSDFLKKLRKP
jgi:hypothetical protein